ncbi:unnamed protein product [Darwinula stevensoni]|uniref:Interferon-induced very large GTPase 1-like n=1 Tax=Darwinula stevensoni TaxID=69355 RepID=A0A7R8X639_9CRUS|nr:unnamed protein product [Darwinula stevensoni]CAG0885349.1 unnamed protein product [Darwinula stevensoni]
MECESLQLTCLGRPFQLGTLYDRRSDTIVAGMTLWNMTALEKNITESQLSSCYSEIIAEDSISEKTSALDIDASLKLSFLGGLVEVSGSGKYLDDRKSSSKQARIVLQFKSKSCFKGLTMEQLGTDGIEHPEVFEKDIATHVVTRIEYGADAFFVFDREVSSNETVRDVEGKLNVAFEKIKGLPIKGEATAKVKEQEKLETYQLRCKYYGDILLEKNPTTFEEGLQIFQELPARSKKENVPKCVHLFPLHKLNNRAIRLIKEIRVGIVQDVEEILESLHAVKVKANDLDKSKVCDHFWGVRTQLKIFRSLVDEFKAKFQKKISSIFKAVRACRAEEVSLSKIVEQTIASPFNNEILSVWLTGKDVDIKTLEKYLEFFEEVPVAFAPGDFCIITKDPKITCAICFAFGVGPKTEPFLERMSTYLKEEGLDSSSLGRETPQFWFDDQEIMQAMQVDTINFLDFFKANKSKCNLKFFVTEMQLENASHEIFLYESGVRSRFVPPGIPGAPKALEVTKDTIQLSWEPPCHGLEFVEGYQVSYRPLTCDDEWFEHAVTENIVNATIKDLLPNRRYVFRDEDSDEDLNDTPNIHPCDILVIALQNSEPSLRQLLLGRLFSIGHGMPVVSPVSPIAATSELKDKTLELLVWALQDIDVKYCGLYHPLVEFQAPFIGLPLGKARRLVSNGVLEMAWLKMSLSPGRATGDSEESSKVEPAFILNLRGDALYSPEQVQLLGKICSLVILFLGNVPTQSKEGKKEKKEQLVELERKMRDSSFGMDNIFRELAQIYECLIVSKDKGKVSGLPSIMASLILAGMPLELLDGDNGYIPMKWLTDIFKCIESKVGKIWVLSVIGIQSSGKSTMLNTIFGSDFLARTGRCTKGVYMQFFPFGKMSHEDESRTHYLVLLDSEGLGAPEFADDYSRRRDNELATFAIGLADLTLLNVMGETPSDVKDLLPTVLHGFIRMNEVKISPKVVIIHQNVREDAHRSRLQGLKKMQEVLDEMTIVAAKEEDSYPKISSFHDVIKLNLTKDAHYFPSLFISGKLTIHSEEYGCKAKQMKSVILEKLRSCSGRNMNIFSRHLEGLWEAIMEENFAFNFRNVMEMAAYNDVESMLQSLVYEADNRLFRSWDEWKGEIMRANDVYKVQEVCERKKKELEPLVEKIIEEKVQELHEMINSSERKGLCLIWCERIISQLRGIIVAKRDQIRELFHVEERKQWELFHRKDAVAKVMKEMEMEIEKNGKGRDGAFDEVWNRREGDLMRAMYLNSTYLSNEDALSEEIKSELLKMIPERHHKEIQCWDVKAEKKEETPSHLGGIIDEANAYLKLACPIEIGFVQESCSEIPVKEVLPLLREKLSKEKGTNFAFSQMDLLADHVDSPISRLLKNLLGCLERCPFCGAECEHSFENHVDPDAIVPFKEPSIMQKLKSKMGMEDKQKGSVALHATEIHIPQCLRGYQDNITGEMALTTCPEDVRTEAQFGKSDEEKWTLYKEYRRKFPAWDIPPKKQEATPLFWKRFIARNEEALAKTYGMKVSSELPSAWKHYTDEEVRANLRSLYFLE